jgi:hypothetical protein
MSGPLSAFNRFVPLSGDEYSPDNGAGLDMGIPSRPMFSHRTLNDGSVESICMKCFLTISRTWGDFKITEKELVEIEATHECDKSHKSKQFLNFKLHHCRPFGTKSLLAHRAK